MKMPQDLKDNWIASLRSGEYKQDRVFLRTDKGYCCLGVLQQIADGDVERLVNHDATPASFPTKAWCAAHGVIDEVPFMTRLVTMNDRDLCTFHKIADVIEKEVEGY